MQIPSNDEIRDLRSVELSSTLPVIRIDTTGKVRVTVAIDNETIYDEWLYPSGGYVLLQELRDLVEPYAYTRQTVTVSLAATTEDGSTLASQTATVVYCECDFGDVDAADYLATHFLSILQGPKLTAMGRLEILPVQGTEEGTCVAKYSDGTTQSFAVGTYLAASGPRLFTELDTSPSQFCVAGKTLVSYTVTVGRRSQEYIIDLHAPDCAPILVFFNSFGVEEVVYCTGIHKVAPDYKRSMAFVGYRQRNYRIDETRSFKADSGPLTIPMANWFDDLFRSRYVRIANLVDGEIEPAREVVITESKSEYSNDDAEIPRFTFSYQYAQRIHNVIDLNREGRIFDNTFDNTFN